MRVLCVAQQVYGAALAARVRAARPVLPAAAAIISGAQNHLGLRVGLRRLDNVGFWRSARPGELLGHRLRSGRRARRSSRRDLSIHTAGSPPELAVFGKKPYLPILPIIMQLLEHLGTQTHFGSSSCLGSVHGLSRLFV